MGIHLLKYYIKNDVTIHPFWKDVLKAWCKGNYKTGATNLTSAQILHMDIEYNSALVTSTLLQRGTARKHWILLKFQGFAKIKDLFDKVKMAHTGPKMRKSIRLNTNRIPVQWVDKLRVEGYVTDFGYI